MTTSTDLLREALDDFAPATAERAATRRLDEQLVASALARTPDAWDTTVSGNPLPSTSWVYSTCTGSPATCQCASAQIEGLEIAAPSAALL